jgi:flavin-dependent dehydrogenase
VVIGAGPAGSAAARMLSRLGHDVLVLAGGARPRSPLAESLPPSCRRPLAALGMLEPVLEAGFYPTRGNSSAWADPDLRSVDFEAETGFQVVRADLDRVLLGSAVAAGSRVLHGARVTAGSPGEATIVRWRGESEEGAARPRWVLDCSGRSGVLARRGLRIAGTAPVTIALIGIWRRPGGWELPDPSHTIVEAYDAGWCWSVPVSDEARYVAVMLDPAISGGSPGRGVSGTYRRELGRTLHLRRLLSGATLQGRVSGCDSTTYSARRYAGESFLLVGDAGSFIDPLSSFGVKKALASGWLAAVTLNTILRTPGMRSAALEFYEEREGETQRVYTERARRQYVVGAERFGTAYWRTRIGAGGGAGNGDPDHRTGASGSRDLPAFAGGSEAVAGPRHIPAARLREALIAIREASPLRLRLHPSVRRVPRATVEGHEIVLRDHLVGGSAPEGIRYLGTVILPILAEQFAEGIEVPELYSRYCAAAEAVDLKAFLSALASMVALGLASLD